ncbi:glycosyltransferase family 2 protein [Chitinispirillales bacterium ANBcel5]|uniref:glycosyltransferase family 2 protein n=1 Tax=Cellulosispirillum alkaliphilum TaxID=3039283 RepID=UPI002A50B608|nr:glycosyltransferase family 2 protein [Chitinispirillales bacterium ANBcel5]
MLLAIEVIFWVSIFVILYSYFFYPFILAILARFFSTPVKCSDNYLPSIGVLVPAYNEESVIEKKIINILSIDYPADKLSVWVGSDCSTDRTEEIVSAYDDQRVHLWRAPERGGKTGVLNGLAPVIDAEIVLFTDANTMHRPDSLRAIVRNFADPKVGGVAGHIEHALAEEKENAETLYRSFESKQKYMEGKLHSTISAFGGFYALRKELFSAIPKNAYSNDDVLIPMNTVRKGYRVIYEPEAISEEDFTEKISSEFSRRVRIGAGNFQAFFWLRDFLNPFLGWPWFCFFSHKVTRWFSPHFFILAAFSSTLLFFATDMTLYRVIYSTAAVFMLSGIAYRIFPLRICRHIFYFLTMNCALFLGFIRFISGIQSAAWSRTERG